MKQYDSGEQDGPTVAERPGDSTSGSRDVEKNEVLSGELIDHFRVLRPIGQGGMGRVYLARDTKLGRKVALKLVRPKRIGPENAVQRFVQEARTIARFNHPNIVTIYEVGEHHGSPYLALEYLNGDTVRERIQSQLPSLQETLRLGAAVASALAEAHRHGVLHLDLKPGNILIPQDGRVRVLDFGLAQPITSLRPESSISEGNGARKNTPAVNDFVGTPRYMSPEQWRREAPTAATDVWGLGVVIFELACGERPFKADETSPLSLAKAVSGPRKARRLDSLPELADLVGRCLEKKPSDRPTAEEVADELQLLLSGPRRSHEKESPFRGLLPFTARHAELFFGREREIEELVERLRDEPVMPVVGASGAGKSSLVQAGVIPRLTEQGRWEVLELRPGPDPFKALAHRLVGREHSSLHDSSDVPTVLRTNAGQVEAVARELFNTPERLSVLLEHTAEIEDARVLLFVDQIEEVYTLSQDVEQQNRFIRAIVRAADDAEDPVRVVFTVRDDFLSRLANAGSDVRFVLRRMMLLQVPEQSALKQTLLKPLDMVGYSFEDPEMVDRMVAEVGDKPSSLPLLQFAAQMLWERRDRHRRVLTKATYEGFGGVAGALARHADGVLDSLLETEVAVAREILLRLVTSEKTRKVVAREEVVAGLGPDGESVLMRLVGARLVSAVRLRDEQGARQALELAHESLISGWHRLRTWLDENQEELRLLNEVSQAAQLWEKRGNRTEEVWTGTALFEALRTLERISIPVPEPVQRFLAAGKRRQRQLVMRKRGVIGGAFVVLMMVAAVLFIQRQREVIQRQRAEAERAEAQREGAGAALERGDLLEARAKIRSSLETSDSSLARFIWWRMRKEVLLWRRALSTSPWRVAFSPDGRTIAAAMTDGSLHLYDVMTRQPRALAAYADQPSAVEYAPGGKMLAVATSDSKVFLWDLVRRESVRTLNGHTSLVRGMAFIDDDQLVTSDQAGRVVLWQVSTGKLVRVLRSDGPRIESLDYNPKTRRLVTAGTEAIDFWDVDKGKVGSIKVSDRIDDVAFNHSGEFVAGAVRKTQVRIWSVDSKELMQKIEMKVNPLTVVFAKDGRVMVGGQDGIIKIYDSTTAKLLGQFQGHLSSVQTLALSKDGRRLASGSVDNSLRLWDTEAQISSPVFLPHLDGVVSVAFSPDGRSMATGGYDQTVRLWNTESGKVERMWDADVGIVWSLAFSPDSELLAWGGSALRVANLKENAPIISLRSLRPDRIRGIEFSADSQRLYAVEGPLLKVYDLKGKESDKTIGKAQSNLRSLALSRDGRWLGAGGLDDLVHIWDANNGEMKASLRGHSRGVHGVDFDPTGRFVVSSSKDGTIRFWNWNRGKGRVVGRVDGRVRFYEMDVSPDGVWAATSGSDRIPRIWNVRTGGLKEKLEPHGGEVNTVRFSPDGSHLATGSDDATVRLFDSRTGQALWRAPLLLQSTRELFTHAGWVDLATGQADKPKPTKWRRAIEERARLAVEVSGDDALCMMTRDRALEIWSRNESRRLDRKTTGKLMDIISVEGGCLLKFEDRLELYELSKKTSRRLTETAVSAAGGVQDRFVWAQSSTISVVSRSGRRLETYPGHSLVSALAVSDEWIIKGHRYGGLGLISRRGDGKLHSFQDTTSSPVTRVLLGPEGTLLAGFKDGVVGLWDIETGKLLYFERLHGAIVHLVWDGAWVYAVSELGWFTRWDLGVFEQPWCAVLEEVWSMVPVVWQSGRAVAERPSPHPCRQVALE